MILGYPPIVVLESLKEWKVAITLVGQGYESTEGCQDYKIRTGTIYSGLGQLMDIGKSNNNFKDRKPKYFNYNKYNHMVKECWKKNEKETRRCFKYDKEEHMSRLLTMDLTFIFVSYFIFSFPFLFFYFFYF